MSQVTLTNNSFSQASIVEVDWAAEDDKYSCCIALFVCDSDDAYDNLTYYFGEWEEDTIYKVGAVVYFSPRQKFYQFQSNSDYGWQEIPGISDCWEEYAFYSDEVANILLNEKRIGFYCPIAIPNTSVYAEIVHIEPSTYLFGDSGTSTYWFEYSKFLGCYLVVTDLYISDIQSSSSASDIIINDYWLAKKESTHSDGSIEYSATYRKIYSIPCYDPIGGVIIPDPDEPEIPEVAVWSWDASNGDAIENETVNETKIAYYAVKYPQCENKESSEALNMLNPETNSPYTVNDFSHRVWNDLVNKVMETIIADATKNGYQSDNPEDDWWNTRSDLGVDYIPYSETLMYDDPDDEDSRKLTADRFNSLKFNIGSRADSGYIEDGEFKSGTGIADVLSGGIVYGWYFTRLTESLNNWINSVNDR